MVKRVWTYLMVGAALLVLSVALMNTFALYVPKSALGWARFRWEYNHTNDESGYLDSYRDRIWEHGGGYIPPDVARFLSSRLESSSDEGEVSAIARFYSRQAGGREPVTLFDLSDKARRRIARAVLHDWKSYPDKDAQHGFVLLEELRLNTDASTFKANVIMPHGGRADSPEKLAPVARLFERWNLEYDLIPFTKRPNPLAGTVYTIEGL